MVSRHSAAYAVDAPLIYAIMEQESSFNPVAQSWVPAYGLMQLVPKSGGRDAYRYVHKTDAIPSADFLFDPDNNIQLGTGYLKLLMSTTFKKIEDIYENEKPAVTPYAFGVSPFVLADLFGMSGATIKDITIPVCGTQSADADGNYVFTLSIFKNTEPADFFIVFSSDYFTDTIILQQIFSAPNASKNPFLSIASISGLILRI